jgi:cell division transport system permease protein
MPYAIREAFAAFQRAPLLTSLSSAMIGLSLLVVGLFGVTAHNIRQVLDRVEARVELVAYLHDSASPAAVRALQEEIATFPEVQEVLYISRDQALEIARQELGELRPIFADLENNPLPASLEIKLHRGQRDPVVIEEIADRVSIFPVVEEVRFGQEFLEKIFLLRRVAAAAAAVLGGAFAIVAILIIGAAIRLAIFARRDEIAIMRLVGATDGFIQRPFLLEGLATGLLGSAIALPSTFILYRLLSENIVQLEWIPDAWVLAGVLAGGLLGVGASAIAVRRHLAEV